MKINGMILVAALLVLLDGCIILGVRAKKGMQAQEVTGKVKVSCTLTRISGPASN